MAVPLSSIAKQRVAKAPPGFTPYIEIGDISPKTKAITLKSKPPVLNAKLAFEGDVLVSTVRPGRGAVALAPRDASVSTALTVLIGVSISDSHFIFHVVGQRHFAAHLDRLATGSTYPTCSDADVLGFRLLVPPSSERARIAEVLDAADDAIGGADRVISKLERVEQGLSDELLTKGIDDNGELRDLERSPDLFEDSPIGRFPKGWKVRALDELTVAPICYGIVQAGNFVPNGPQVLMIRDLDGDFRTGLHRASTAIDTQYTRSRVGGGDVLLSIKGTIGRVGVVPAHFAGNISRDLARLRFSERVLPDFARLYLQSRHGQLRLELAVVGTTRSEVSIHTLKRWLMPVPSHGEQERIVAAMLAVEERLHAERSKCAKLRSLKLGLADDLLSWSSVVV